MADFFIRDFRESDADALAQLEKECFSNPWSKKALIEELTNPNANFLVCEKDGQICGYIGSIFVYDEASITNVAVSLNYRRQKIGENLIKALILRAEEKGISNIFLEVRKSNEVAQKLYKKCDFKEISVRKGFYSNPLEDAVIMNFRVKK